MKITTRNINGLRAVFWKEADRDWRKEKPNVLYLQEIRAAPDQLTSKQHRRLQDYAATRHPTHRPGYSGVATLTRGKPRPSQCGLGMPQFDREGRLIRTRFPEFILFNVYFPNSQRSLKRLDYKLLFYRELLDRCLALYTAGKQIIICGDFNTAHRPIDLHNPQQNEKNAGHLPEERKEIDRYLEQGFGMPIGCWTPTGKNTLGGRTVSRPGRGTSAGAWITFWSPTP